MPPPPEDAESTYAKAVKAEFSKDLDSAFGLYIKAAESFLHLSRSIDHERDKAKWKASAGKALERAEKIKAFVEKSKPPLSSDPSRSEARLTPVGVDYFSPQEQSYAVKKGGIINHCLFPLWDERPSNDLDPDGEMGLSPEQRKVAPQWRRSLSGPESERDGEFEDSLRLRPQDILQHIITDCSVCASISVCLEYGQRFGAEFGYVSLRESEPGASLPSPISKSHRGIVIDDRLPYHPTTGALVCMSSAPVQGRCPAWPSLLEKGYMKLMGGYDFPGSNSSIDLHALVGWIPEHLEIKSPSFERERTWARIVDAFFAGQCMLTVGTGVGTDISWRGINLLPSHSYAVIDVKEDDASRGFTVLDSWIQAHDESATETDQTSRVLEIPWSDVLEVFDSIYLSWDPRIWPKNLIFHGTWKQSGAEDKRSTRHLRLKFDSTSRNAEEEVWVLLTRHVVDTRRTSDFISLRVQLEDDLAGSADSGDHRKIATKGTYTNSTHVLARTRLALQSSGSLSVFASYDGNAPEVGFTLSVYAPSTVSVAWEEKMPVPPFSSKVEGTLTSKNAGGNSTHPTFMVNPQYHLRINPPKHAGSARKADVSLIMQMGRDVPVNIAVAWSQGSRVFELSQKDLAGSSGAYTYVGDYTVILSAFEANQMGSFSLEVESSLSFDLKAIPQEGAGMYTKTIRGAWNSQNAMGGPSFKQYSQNPIYEIDVQSLTELRVRLQLLRPKTTTAVNLTIFPSSATGSLGRHITTSGGYDDSIAGVTTPQISLGVGKYWVIPSTYNPGFQGAFQLIVYSTAARVNVAERVPSSQ
ncbi:hypothetical protein B0H17DRAFT_1222383 [Mycena rosella]|uniref:Calpain catalytic domain-containing protein n=1 Tax=Mycena rosella TaxID=1033263 RepID=A0AAD7AY29_MYCRO|nr:hypothetical protein B0H17DRAFT_1222383 [Mycena rosella]